jgi:hypothetical protein
MSLFVVNNHINERESIFVRFGSRQTMYVVFGFELKMEIKNWKIRN